MPEHAKTRYERIKQRWMEFWGLVFFLGVLINFTEITAARFSIFPSTSCMTCPSGSPSGPS